MEGIRSRRRECVTVVFRVAPDNGQAEALAGTLTHGRYFVMDSMSDGVELLSAPHAPVSQPLAPDVALSETQAHCEDWIPSAAKALKGAKFYVDEGDFNDAAFLLHKPQRGSTTASCW